MIMKRGGVLLLRRSVLIMSRCQRDMSRRPLTRYGGRRWTVHSQRNKVYIYIYIYICLYHYHYHFPYLYLYHYHCHYWCYCYCYRFNYYYYHHHYHYHLSLSLSCQTLWVWIRLLPRAEYRMPREKWISDGGSTYSEVERSLSLSLSLSAARQLSLNTLSQCLFATPIPNSRNSREVCFSLSHYHSLLYSLIIIINLSLSISHYQYHHQSLSLFLSIKCSTLLLSRHYRIRSLEISVMSLDMIMLGSWQEMWVLIQMRHVSC